MEENFGLAHFLERRAKRSDQRVRKIANEPHRVGQQNLSAAGQLDRAQLRIERGEHRDDSRTPARVMALNSVLLPALV